MHLVEFEKPRREIVFLCFSFFNKAHSQDIHASNLEFVYSTCWFLGLKNIFCHSDLTTDRTGVTSFVLSGHVLKMTRRCLFLCRERIINYRSKSLKNTQKKGFTLPKFNSSPVKSYPKPNRKAGSSSNFPPFFRGKLAVKLRGCILA